MSENDNAVKSSALINRIKYNSSQSLDFIEWIFSGIDIKENSNIVEFCCGTGKQTFEFVKRVDECSSVFAFDIEADSVKHVNNNLPECKLQSFECSVLDFNDFNMVECKLPDYIDLFFCSYGLYYNNRPLDFLELIMERLNEDSQIVIVGPYGNNNNELFSFLERFGVQIGHYVKYTSSTFMPEVIVPWMCDNFKDISITTEKNLVTWNSVESVYNYWVNSTFYDSELDSIIKDELECFFESRGSFDNYKYLMKAICKNVF